MTKIPLGKVAFTDAGSYNAGKTYKRFDFVDTEDSSYLSLQDKITRDTPSLKPLGGNASHGAQKPQKPQKKPTMRLHWQTKKLWRQIRRLGV